VNADVLILWLERNSLELVNTPDVPTFYRPDLVRASIIDLAFATADMFTEVRDWEASWELHTGSNHVLIRFGIATRFTELVENPLCSAPYNFDKADWARFHNCLITYSSTVLEQYHSSTNHTEEGYERLATAMQECIRKAADESIPRKRLSIRSKPWWNPELNHLKKAQACVHRRVRNGHASEEAYREALAAYHKAFYKAQNDCWDEFLASAQGKEVFRANGYSKQRQIGKLPSL
jgi:hypothetical protein